MTIPGKILAMLVGAVASMLLGGCSTNEMKGTPFYSGDYLARRGPAEQRINAWPLFYYRDPALSVLWPIFEKTDEHTAVRPFFSIYAQDKTNRDYSVLWPIAEFDRQTHDSRIFPAFWGDDYRVGFPLYWHFGNLSGPGEVTDSLLPLWFIQRDRSSSLFISPLWLSGANSNGSAWQMLTPLYYRESGPEHSAIVTPFWAQGRSDSHDWKAITPLVFWDQPAHTLISPLWAHWTHLGDEIYFAPWLLSWEERNAGGNDLWLAAALAHASWGTNSGSHYAFPFYYRDAHEQELLTPLFGWNKSPDGFIYPFTPLAGEWFGRSTGSWLFPLYSHSRDTKSGEVTDRFLVTAGHSTFKTQKETWCFPLFDYTDSGPLNSVPEPKVRYAVYGKDFLCFPYCWYVNQTTLMGPPPKGGAQVDTNAPLVRSGEFKHGAFPFWSYEHQTAPAENINHTEGSILLRLYDYKHEIDPPSLKSHGQANDYTRARILWRIWHYERLNGDVSVDAFPSFNYDHKTDGFQKTSLLWRLFRYERSASGSKKLDLLYIPILHQNS